MSKLKRWRLGEVLRKAVQVAVEPSAVDLETTQPTVRFEIAARRKGPGGNHDWDAHHPGGGR